jgi:hypothetical protein
MNNYKMIGKLREADPEYDLKHLPIVFTFVSKSDLEMSDGLWVSLYFKPMIKHLSKDLDDFTVMDIAATQLLCMQDILWSMHSANSPAENASKLLHMKEVDILPDHVSFSIDSDDIIWVTLGFHADMIAGITAQKLLTKLLRLRFPVIMHGTRDLLIKIVNTYKIELVNLSFHMERKVKIKAPVEHEESEFDMSIKDDGTTLNVKTGVLDETILTLNKTSTPPRPSITMTKAVISAAAKLMPSKRTVKTLIKSNSFDSASLSKQ